MSGSSDWWQPLIAFILPAMSGIAVLIKKPSPAELAAVTQVSRRLDDLERQFIPGGELKLSLSNLHNEITDLKQDLKDLRIDIKDIQREVRESNGHSKK